MGKKQEKTNVMRVLDAQRIPYTTHSYDNTLLNAVEVASAVGLPPDAVFKTLVTVGKSGTPYVFMVPGVAELDLKKAARAAGEKSLEMLPQKQLLPLTGYVHGGCSPIGMKKAFATFVHTTAAAHDTICFSAGRVGQQVQLTLAGLQQVLPVAVADIAKDI